MKAQPQAVCYLTTVNDDQNKAELWENSLQITAGGKIFQYDLVQIQNLSFNHRRPLLYLVGGGIVVPFTFLAFSEGFLDPYWAIVLLIGGLLSLYFGWMGYEAFTVQQFTHHRDFRLPYISKNLREFTKFVVHRLPINQSLEQEKYIYHICSTKSWASNRKQNFYRKSSSEPFIHASSYDQIQGTLNKHFKKAKDLLLISIDPLLVSAEVRYEDLYESGQLFPHIYGDLNLDAVKKVEPI